MFECFVKRFTKGKTGCPAGVEQKANLKNIQCSPRSSRAHRSRESVDQIVFSQARNSNDAHCLLHRRVQFMRFWFHVTYLNLTRSVVS